MHEDEALLVLDKPSGLLAVPGRGDDKQDCLANRVRGRFADALVVHRLDMATSGLMLMARSIAVQRELSRAFATRAVLKRYVAVVAGEVAAQPQDDDGWQTIDLPLAADWPNRPRQKVDMANGKASLTRYRVLERDAASATTRLELEPLTGRTHQLRVHLMAIGHPILGDALYAPHDVAAMAPRLMLHARRLDFMHPTRGERVNHVIDVPF